MQTNQNQSAAKSKKPITCTVVYSTEYGCGHVYYASKNSINPTDRRAKKNEGILGYYDKDYERTLKLDETYFGDFDISDDPKKIKKKIKEILDSRNLGYWSSNDGSWNWITPSTTKIIVEVA